VAHRHDGAADGVPLLRVVRVLHPPQPVSFGSGSILEAHGVPHRWQTYSCFSPSSRTSRSRLRTGIACRQRGQWRRLASSDAYASGGRRRGGPPSIPPSLARRPRVRNATRLRARDPAARSRARRMPTVYIETYGCQMNVADTELMLGQLAA